MVNPITEFLINLVFGKPYDECVPKCQVPIRNEWDILKNNSMPTMGVPYKHCQMCVRIYGDCPLSNRGKSKQNVNSLSNSFHTGYCPAYYGDIMEKFM